MAEGWHWPLTSRTVIYSTGRGAPQEIEADGSAMSLLPHIDTPGAYRILHPDSSTWLPAVALLADRHGLAAEQFVRVSEGTNVVFASDDLVLKLFPPHWAH